jgi:aspartyl-tRNA synthetase
MELHDLGPVFAGTAVGVFAGVLEAGGKVLGLVIDGGAEPTRKQLGALTDQAKARGAADRAQVARTVLGDLRVRLAAERGLCTYWRPAPARSAT